MTQSRSIGTTGGEFGSAFDFFVGDLHYHRAVGGSRLG